MKKLLLTATVVLATLLLHSQVVYDYLKAADTYYKAGNYYAAAQYYEKYLTQHKVKINKEGAYNPYVIQTAARGNVKTMSSLEQAVYNTADSYRKLHYYEKAEPYYVMASQYDKTQFPLSNFYYAETARAMKKYDVAEKAYTAFLDEHKQEDRYSDAAKREIQSLRFIQNEMQKSLKRYTVFKGSKGLNDTGASYAPVWIGENELMFTSTRPDKTSKGKQFINRVYETGFSADSLSNLRKTALAQTENVHQGAVSMSADKQTLYLTRWQSDEKGQKSTSIYFSKKTSGGWSEPVLMDAQVNLPGSRNQQPYIMEDGKHLLFASDRTGGIGGFDIWIATLDEKGMVTGVENAGATINTIFDEEAPFYHHASSSLVFSTNGRVGMGGYDFFSSKGTLGNWSTPQNLGYPVNSIKDDIYFTSRGPSRNILEDVVLSSDREASCCLELFFLKKEKPMKQVSGIITSCEGNQPISGATVLVVDTITNTTVFSKKTGEDGKYAFELEDFQPLKVVASSNGFTGNNLSFHAPVNIDEDVLQNPALCLQPIVPVITVLGNVFYDYDKSSLRKESFGSLDSVAAFMNENPLVAIEIRAHTDNKGSDAYNQKLSDARASSVVNYLKSKGISPDRLISKGFGSTMPVAPNANEDGSDNPDGRQLNRRTEFTVIRN